MSYRTSVCLTTLMLLTTVFCWYAVGYDNGVTDTKKTVCEVSK